MEKHRLEEFVSMKDAASRVGISPSAVRYWVRKLNLPVYQPSAGGKRKYLDNSDVKRLELRHELVPEHMVLLI